MRTPTIFLTTLLALSLAGCGDLSEGGTISVSYTPDSHLVAFLDGETRVLDRDAKSIQRKIGTRRSSGGGWIPFSPRYLVSSDGARFAVAVDRDVDIHDLATGERIATIAADRSPMESYPIGGIALSAHGDLLAVSVRPIVSAPPAMAAPHLDIWRVSDGTKLVSLTPTPIDGTPKFDNVRSSWDAGLAFSPDGRVLYGIETVPMADDSSAKQVLTAWSVADGAPLWKSTLPPEVYHDVSEGTPARFDSLALSPDGATLATGSTEVVLWRAVDGARVTSFLTPQTNSAASAIAYSVDGQVATTYATNFTDKDSIVFGTTGAIAQQWPVEGGGCEGLSFSPDGKRLAAACAKFIKVWDPTTGDVIARVKSTTTLY
jgi:WD40 repeat protein